MAVIASSIFIRFTSPRCVGYVGELPVAVPPLAVVEAEYSTAVFVNPAPAGNDVAETARVLHLEESALDNLSSV